MTIFRLLLLFLFGRLVRRFYLSVKSRVFPAAGGRPRNPGVENGSTPPQPGKPMKDLTEQDISDADFEEIP